MFQLPFHIDSPLAAGSVELALSLVVAFLLREHRRGTTLGRAIQGFFEPKISRSDPEKARKLGRGILIFMAGVLGAVAVFDIAVGTALIENGDPPRAVTMDEFLQRHRE